MQALEPRLPVLLLSGPGAASYAGAGWWRALVRIALHESGHPAPDAPDAPDAIDCEDQPGRALEALALGSRILVLHPCPAAPAVAARYPGALILPRRPDALDLAERHRPGRLLEWLRQPRPQGDTGAAIG